MVAKLLAAFSKELGTDLRFHPGSESDRAERPFFLGYATAVNTLFIDKKPHHSLRYITLDNDVVYEDYGIALYAPLGEATAALAPFLPESARYALLLCGAHRLGTGVLCRLFEDEDLQKRVLGQHFTPTRRGAFALCITLTRGNLTSEEKFDVIWRSDARR